MSGAVLGREAILQHRPPRYEDVPVPELATDDGPAPVVRIQALSSTACDRFIASLWVEGPDGKIRYNRQDYAAKLLVLSAVDEKGGRVFEDAHVGAIGLLDGAIVRRLAVVAERLSGLSVEQGETAKGN